jgi:type I restriction enzyme S subunit
LTGESPSDWPRLTLGEICAKSGGFIQTGPFGSQLHASDYTTMGVPVVMPVNIGENRIAEEAIARIPPHEAARLERHKLRPGNIVYGRRGDIGRRALITTNEDGWLCGTGCLRIDLGNGVLDPEFATYFLSSPQTRDWIVRRAVGTTMPNLNTAILSAVPFVVPPVAEQREIGRALGALDDKISLNRRMNRTLESMARAIFRSWFVDFDPVVAKAAGRQPFGMPADVAALFPDRFVDAEVGPTPATWEPCKWGDVSTLEYGKSLRTHGDAAGAVRVYGTNGPIGWHTEALCPTAGVVIGRKGAYRGVHYSPAPFFVIDTAFYLRPKREFEILWAYYELLHLDINGMDSGSAIPSTSRDEFYQVPVLFPPPLIHAAFGGIVGPMFKQMEANQEQSRTLAALRDTLLPKLMSGELRVREAEALVGTHV